jgi:hypothetical protein
MQPDRASLPQLQQQTDKVDRLFELLAGLARDLPGDGAAGQPGEAVSLWQDDSFQRRFRLLQIQRLAVIALAARAGADECLSAAAHCRVDQLGRDLAALAISSLGYYALPDPDPLLIDNEGPIGHHQALSTMRSLATYFEPGQPGEGGETTVTGDISYLQKSRIASRVFANELDTRGA